MSESTPDPQSWREFSFDVGDGHCLHVELSGNPDGRPVVCLHGGPASGMSVAHRRFFDAERYHIIQFDQRGCGRSTPRGEMADNTTDKLVSDIEALRQHLDIDRWLVLGGSWGATLGLVYAAAHPSACLGLVLRGFFTGSEMAVADFFDGHRALSPAGHDLLATLAPDEYRARLGHWVPVLMTGSDVELQSRVARAWQAWEAIMDGGPVPDLSVAEHPETERARIDKYRVQAHYLAHACFLAPGWWQDAAAYLADMPIELIHGMDDRICPIESSRVLHRLLPRSVLTEVVGCRHNPFEPAMLAAVRAATDRFLALDDGGA